MKNVYVLDASVALKAQLTEAGSDQARKLVLDFISGEIQLIAPSTILVEIGHALTRAERRGIIPVGDSERLYKGFLRTSPRLIDFPQLLFRAITLSSETRTGVYDCLYVALAEREECELITADERLVNTMAGKFDRIVILAQK